MGKYKMIDQDSRDGIYDLDCSEMIVELEDGGRVYLVEGYGGEQSVAGGAYRWSQGAAYKITPEDDIASLHEDSEDYERIIAGYDSERPILDWPGSMIEVVVKATLASEAARALGSLGGSVKGSPAKSEAAKARNAARKAQGKLEGGRPSYSQAAAREIERENKRFASLPAEASEKGMGRYAEEHVRIIDGIIAKYGCRKEVTKVLANGIKCITIYDKGGAIVAEHHE